jgi:hypothetical protein
MKRLDLSNLNPDSNTVMNNTAKIINDYLEALTERAEMAGDDRLAYVMGFLQGTLKTLGLQGYELEVLQRDTVNLRELIAGK